MNANAAKLAAAIAAAALATKFGPKPKKTVTPEQLRADLDKLNATAAQHVKRVHAQNTELIEKIDLLMKQNQFLVSLLEKYNVPLDEFDRIALTDLFTQK